MPNECEHFWILDEVDGATGARGRTLRMHCEKCSEPRSLVTAASDEQIAAEFAAQ